MLADFLLHLLWINLLDPHLKSLRGIFMCSQQCLEAARQRNLRGYVSVRPWTVWDAPFCSFPEGEELHVGEKSVKAGIGLTTLSHEASEGDHLGGTGGLALLVTLNGSKRQHG